MQPPTSTKLITTNLQRTLGVLKQYFNTSFYGLLLGLVHLVRTQNFQKTYYFLLPTDTHMYVCVSGGKKC